MALIARMSRECSGREYSGENKIGAERGGICGESSTILNERVELVVQRLQGITSARVWSLPIPLERGPPRRKKIPKVNARHVASKYNLHT